MQVGVCAIRRWLTRNRVLWQGNINTKHETQSLQTEEKERKTALSPHFERSLLCLLSCSSPRLLTAELRCRNEEKWKMRKKNTIHKRPERQKAENEENTKIEKGEWDRDTDRVLWIEIYRPALYSVFRLCDFIPTRFPALSCSIIDHLLIFFPFTPSQFCCCSKPPSPLRSCPLQLI